MVALPLQDVLQVRWLPWKAGLYSGHFGKAISLQRYIFQMGGLVFDTTSKQDMRTIEKAIKK